MSKVMIPLYTLKLRGIVYSDGENVSYDIYYGQPFAFRNDDQAISTFESAFDGDNRDKIIAVYEIGKYDPISGRVVGVRKKREVKSYVAQKSE